VIGNRSVLYFEKNMETNKNYYVYVISETKGMKPIYVGKGVGNRCYWHIYAVKSNYHYNRKLYNKIKKITKNFTEMQNITIHKDNYFEKECEAFNREKELISNIGIDNLCNLTAGGDGASLSKDIIKKIIKSRKSNGKPWHTSQTKINIGNSRRGKHHSEETRAKLREINLGEKSCRFSVKHTDKAKILMSKNHCDFFGEKNPFYGKTHSQETKDYFRLRYGCEWIILHDNKRTIVIGKSAVKKYVEDYNIKNNTTMSYKTLLMYKQIKKYNIKLMKNNGVSNG
jgi:hypothetical protein